MRLQYGDRELLASIEKADKSRLPELLEQLQKRVNEEYASGGYRYYGMLSDINSAVKRGHLTYWNCYELEWR